MTSDEQRLDARPMIRASGNRIRPVICDGSHADQRAVAPAARLFGPHVVRGDLQPPDGWENAHSAAVARKNKCPLVDGAIRGSHVAS